MFPLHRDLYGRGVDQPFMFINSFEFQWAKNVSSMMKLVKPVDETGTCRVEYNKYNQLLCHYDRYFKMLSCYSKVSLCVFNSILI